MALKADVGSRWLPLPLPPPPWWDTAAGVNVVGEVIDMGAEDGWLWSGVCNDFPVPKVSKLFPAVVPCGCEGNTFTRPAASPPAGVVTVVVVFSMPGTI